MSEIHFSADQHFNSDRTLKYSRRPFGSVGEMNRVLIQNINALPKGATLYSLGDWGEMEYISAVREDIAVRLVMGNWDDHFQRESGMTLEDWRKHWKAKGFDEIYAGPVTLALESGPIWLCHKPSERHTTLFNAFGHIHRASLVKRNGVNVGVDQHSYKPISVDDFLFWKEAVQKHFDDEEWMA